MSNRLGGKQGTAYLGTNAQQPPNWNFYPHNPTIYTYQNFSLGDLWLNTVTQQAFVLVSLERNPITNEFNAIWTDFTDFKCSFNVYHNNQQLAATGAGAQPIVTFTGIRHSVGNFFDTSTSRFVAPVFGQYFFTAQVQCDDPVASFAGMTKGYIQLLVNGIINAVGTLCSPVAVAASVGGGAQITFAVNTIFQLNAGDYVEVSVVIDNGLFNTVNLEPTPTSFFAGQLLSQS